MEYEFKKGDKIKRVRDGNTIFTNKGDIGIVLRSVSTNYGGEGIDYKLDKGGREAHGYIKNYDLVTKRIQKKPTHLVVWEEDTDPCKFFNSLNEANDFVKGLSEKSSVKQDSIILVEIKSAKKITITKVLRPSEYKI